MTVFASLLSAAVIAAAPATPLPWFNMDDYPMKAFEREWRGASVFEVLVTPDGKPANCTITKSSGYEELDKHTCFIAMHRARFSPARGPDGSPMYGTYRSVVMWHRPDQDSLQGEPGPDLEVAVESLPEGTRQPPAVKLAYYVDAAGNHSACTPLPDSRQQPKPLLDAACAQLFGKVARTPVTAGGTAVPAIKTAAVLFTKGE